MANWKQRVNFTVLYNAYEAGELTLQHLSACVANCLKQLTYYGSDPEFTGYADELRNLSLDPSADEDDFDEVLASIYDWGDFDHRLWIDTFSVQDEED